MRARSSTGRERRSEVCGDCGVGAGAGEWLIVGSDAAVGLSDVLLAAVAGDAGSGARTRVDSVDVQVQMMARGGAVKSESEELTRFESR